MARARNIKPGFYKNEDLAECSIWARFIFPGLWMLADRDGRLEDRPKRIKAELLPFDSQEIEPLLVELVRKRFIHRYQSDGIDCIQILQFTKHQSPHYSEKPSVIKPPELPEYSRSEQVIKEVSQPPDSLNPDSLIPESLSAWAKAKGFEHPSLQAHWDYFVDYLAANPKVAARYKDTNAAFRNCVRSDWGNIRKNFVVAQQKKAVDTSCTEMVAGQRCAMPSVERFGGGYICAGHKQKMLDRKPMSADIREKLNTLTGRA